MPLKILINNEILDAENAKISVRDRGFRFGDGVFETIPFYNKICYHFDYHMERLKEGINSIGIYYSFLELKSQVENLINLNQIQDGFVRIIITRGEGSRGYMPTYETEPSLVIEIVERPKMERQSAKLKISKYRKIPSECLPSNQKLMNGLSYSLVKENARKEGFFDGLMLSIDDKICECGAANIFWFKGNKLYTPSLKSPCVAGVTRRIILELSPFEVIEGDFNYLSLSGADEVFITNVTLGVYPVEIIEPSLFKNGKGYKKTNELNEIYLSDIKSKTL
ncbi:MAG: aminotransferase class IV [Rickettsiales bacterium]|nr:aminotransferase class IV [Rickettsiales bacterium]